MRAHQKRKLLLHSRQQKIDRMMLRLFLAPTFKSSPNSASLSPQNSYNLDIYEAVFTLGEHPVSLSKELDRPAQAKIQRVYKHRFPVCVALRPFFRLSSALGATQGLPACVLNAYFTFIDCMSPKNLTYHAVAYRVCKCHAFGMWQGTNASLTNKNEEMTTVLLRHTFLFGISIFFFSLFTVNRAYPLWRIEALGSIKQEEGAGCNPKGIKLSCLLSHNPWALKS